MPAVPAPSLLRGRAFVISLLLIPLNCYWIEQMEIYWFAGSPTTLALFFNVILCMVFLGLLNGAVRRLAPSQALRPSELVVIYARLCMSSALAGQDLVQAIRPSWSVGSPSPRSYGTWAAAGTADSCPPSWA